MVSLVFALATAALLAFASFAKFYKPNPKQEMFDYAIGGVQVLILIGLIALHRKWWTWSGMAVLWAGMAGWSFFKSWHGTSCGCFAALYEPPPYATATLDTVLALVSLGLVMGRAAPKTMVGLTAIALIAAGPAGWGVAAQATPPNLEAPREANPARERARVRM